MSALPSRRQLTVQTTEGRYALAELPGLTTSSASSSNRSGIAKLRNQSANLGVRDYMSDGRPNGFFSTEMWIYVGAALFLVALLVSAIVDPELRVLHCLQALIYVVVIVLARRNSPWGYGAGFAIAIVWNGMNFFG